MTIINQLKNNDFQAFKDADSWVLKETDKIEFFQSDFKLNIQFQKTFPKLTALLQTSRVVHFNLNNIPFRLLSWTIENENRGWLCIIEESTEKQLPLIDEHRLFLKELGGIFSTYNDGLCNLSYGKKFMFTESYCSLGIDGWDNFYDDRCSEDNMLEKDKIDFSNFVVFAQEANGDITTYNPISKEVMLFNHDGDIKDRNGNYLTSLVENQPEDTFYRLKGVTNFIDYIEMLAEQWLNFEE
ncbi:hypothetical protein [Chryseobacterium binzhouense]|uniref:hypothetical protein n=1 Tax=Chryseobacterium binzhouense TaxID=2593646 RepID=UPI00289C81E3|nr:hypothetical protein [Chryseobacterium binzhouense]